MFTFEPTRALRKALYIRDKATERELEPYDTKNPAKKEESEAIKRPIRDRGKMIEISLKKAQSIDELTEILKREKMI
ncbi:hypothetical protein GTG28_20730 [Vibrio sp. OCN044]|uniref:Uncharacterized protein n=1 Tax=Vibrio tetraodonis subsp. pristinus TaxID=2695891 RepID=A0A6L8M2W0_9VIBR|nr:hypothetical protein [Vibrio tetraodonis]MYM61630.1 hypothetical protein [Vibrio tetraodonis subsp. pristinus]